MFKPGQSGNPGGKRDPRTARARMAIAKFVDENADRLQEWLDAIALNDGPKAAFQCFTDIIEYNIPKLARTEHTGENGGPVVHKIERTIVRKP